MDCSTRRRTPLLRFRSSCTPTLRKFLVAYVLPIVGFGIALLLNVFLEEALAALLQ